jgi:hypothetical protein
MCPLKGQVHKKRKICRFGVHLFLLKTFSWKIENNFFFFVVGIISNFLLFAETQKMILKSLLLFFNYLDD